MYNTLCGVELCAGPGRVRSLTNRSLCMRVHNYARGKNAQSPAGRSLTLKCPAAKKAEYACGPARGSADPDRRWWEISPAGCINFAEVAGDVSPQRAGVAEVKGPCAAKRESARPVSRMKNASCGGVRGCSPALMPTRGRRDQLPASALVHFKLEDAARTIFAANERGRQRGQFGPPRSARSGAASACRFPLPCRNRFLRRSSGFH